MVKKLSKMALVCLAMLCLSSTQSPTRVTPTVRVLFQDLELIAYPNHPITIDIYFTNTNNLYIVRSDVLNLTYIPFNDEFRNKPHESHKEYTDVIVEPNHTVEYTVIAESVDWEREYADISFHTYSNPETK